jgi:hypothetical protein
MSVIEHVTSLEQLVTIEGMDLEERGERLADLMVENAKLKELAGCMAKALRIGSGWCNRDCADEFDCDLHECPIEAFMRELGIEVNS